MSQLWPGMQMYHISSRAKRQSCLGIRPSTTHLLPSWNLDEGVLQPPAILRSGTCGMLSSPVSPVAVFTCGLHVARGKIKPLSANSWGERFYFSNSFVAEHIPTWHSCGTSFIQCWLSLETDSIGCVLVKSGKIEQRKGRKKMAHVSCVSRV